jgi:hypothetical protein
LGEGLELAEALRIGIAWAPSWAGFARALTRAGTAGDLGQPPRRLLSILVCRLRLAGAGLATGLCHQAFGLALRHLLVQCA